MPARISDAAPARTESHATASSDHRGADRLRARDGHRVLRHPPIGLHDSGASGGNTGGEGPGGAGGPTSTGGAGTGPAGTGGSGNGGSGPTFAGGPCVVSPDRTAVEVFGRSSDGRILRRAYDGSNWGAWANLPALDGKMIDARSDLDCAAAGTTVHIVAGGLNPVGAVLRAFGFGTAYNPFARELAGLAFGPGPSVAQVQTGCSSSADRVQGCSSLTALPPQGS